MTIEIQVAVLQAKVDSLIEKQKELTARVRANEKVVASVSLLGVIACTIVGAGYFAPRAEAVPTAGEWIQDMREWESEQDRIPIDSMINNAISNLEIDYGINDPTYSEELLQLQSNRNR